MNKWYGFDNVYYSITLQPFDWWIVLSLMLLFIFTAFVGIAGIKKIIFNLSDNMDSMKYHITVLFQDPERIAALDAMLDSLIPPPTTDSPAALASYKIKRKKLKKKLIKTVPMTEDGNTFRGE